MKPTYLLGLVLGALNLVWGSAYGDDSDTLCDNTSDESLTQIQTQMPPFAGRYPSDWNYAGSALDQIDYSIHIVNKTPYDPSHLVSPVAGVVGQHAYYEFYNGSYSTQATRTEPDADAFEIFLGVQEGHGFHSLATIPSDGTIQSDPEYLKLSRAMKKSDFCWNDYVITLKDKHGAPDLQIPPIVANTFAAKSNEAFLHKINEVLLAKHPVSTSVCVNRLQKMSTSRPEQTSTCTARSVSLIGIGKINGVCSIRLRNYGHPIDLQDAEGYLDLPAPGFLKVVNGHRLSWLTLANDKTPIELLGKTQVIDGLSGEGVRFEGRSLMVRQGSDPIFKYVLGTLTGPNGLTKEYENTKLIRVKNLKFPDQSLYTGDVKEMRRDKNGRQQIAPIQGTKQNPDGSTLSFQEGRPWKGRELHPQKQAYEYSDGVIVKVENIPNGAGALFTGEVKDKKGIFDFVSGTLTYKDGKVKKYPE